MKNTVPNICNLLYRTIYLPGITTGHNADAVQ